MTTAGQKIGQFIEGIVAVYNWLSVNGLNRINELLETLQGIKDAADDIRESIESLKRMAEGLGLSLEDLIQIVMSMQSTFGAGPAPTPGAGQAIWGMLGQFANGAGAGAAQALLGNGAGAAGFPRLQPGGGKRKPKSKTNKKRKSKSNKKGKTKTRRR
jgi:hypothetical protein